MSLFLWEGKAWSGVHSLPRNQWQSQNQNLDCQPTCLPAPLAAEQITLHESFTDRRTNEQIKE